MKFQEVTGHKSLHARLTQSIDSDRLAHAMMFLGTTGSGLLPFSLALAQYILCENRATGDACGQCKSCSKVARLIHPDLHFTFPVVKKDNQTDPPLSADRMAEWREAVLANPYMGYNDWLNKMNAENKQGNITARECRDVVNKLGMKTFESPYKVWLVWKAELLKKEGNRLLKIIEEPPDNTVIILMAEDENQILNTILSRTQIYRLPPLSDEEICEALETNTDADPAKIKDLAYLSDGDLNKAMNLAANSEEGHAEQFRQWLLMIIQREWKELLNWVNEMAGQGRERQKHFVQYGLHFVSEALKAKMNPDYQPRISARYHKMIDFLTTNMSLQAMESAAKMLEHLHYYIERNAYTKVHLLNFSLKLKQLIIDKEDVTVEELIR